MNIYIYVYLLYLFFSLLFLLDVRKIKTINSLKVFSRYNFISMTIVLVFLSMSGIPPLVGFVGKFLIFNFLFLTQKYLFILISIKNIYSNREPKCPETTDDRIRDHLVVRDRARATETGALTGAPTTETTETETGAGIGAETEAGTVVETETEAGIAVAIEAAASREETMRTYAVCILLI